MENRKDFFNFIVNNLNVLHGKNAKSLDLLYEHIEDKLLFKEFVHIDYLLKNIKFESYNLPVVLGLLVTTLHSKNDLKERKKFYKRVAKWVIENNPNDYKQILIGLE